MTIWCNTCRRHVCAPCISHQEQGNQRRSCSRRFRSTKGASKARRDHINHEIKNMRALLPISQEDRERLSYLHSMATICTYIRKSVFFQGLLPRGKRCCSLPYEAFLQAVHGFILVTTAQGRLVYVSENVAEYVGISMVDVLQGDTFYDMVERSDIDIVKSNLQLHGENTSTERSFVCCMQTSRAFKLQHGNCCSMLVRGSFRSFPQPCPSSSLCLPPEPLFVAICTPTVDRLKNMDSSYCLSFNSVHRLDMSFTQLSDSVFYFWGYSAEEMACRSWYSLIHPEDLSQSANSHRSLMLADEGFQVEMVLRLQCKDLSWSWIYTRANKDLECQGIKCTNYIISETEAFFLKTKINKESISPLSPESIISSCQLTSQQPRSYGTECSKRQRMTNNHSKELGSRVRRESEQDVYCMASPQGSPVPLSDSRPLFTPPYSPDSSSSLLQQEELSHDLLLDVQGYTDEMLSSPEGSPSYCCYPEAAVLTCQLSPSDSIPAATEQTFDQASFATLSPHSSASSSSPSYDIPACTSDACFVPDCLSVSDRCDSPVDFSLHQDDFSLLQQPQEGSFHQVHQVPQHFLPMHSIFLTPNQSPTSVTTEQYNEKEQAEISILAQQISSLASSFDKYGTLTPLGSSCSWPNQPLQSSGPPLKNDLVVDDGVFDSILKDLDMVSRKSSTSGSAVFHYNNQQELGGSENDAQCSEKEPLDMSPTVSEDSLPVVDAPMNPFSLQLGCHDQNIGLYQLNHYMQCSLQQDGCGE